MYKQKARLKKSFLFLTAGFLLVASVNVYEYILAKNLHVLVKANDALQTQELEMQRIVSHLLDTVGIQRVYLSTQADADREAYKQAKNATFGSISNLQTLLQTSLPQVAAQDTDSFNEKFNSLISKVKLRIEEMDRMNLIAEEGQWTTALLNINSEKNRAILAQIRESALEVQSQLTAKTATLSEATNSMAEKDSLADLFGLILELPFFILAVLSLYRENLHLSQTEHSLQMSKLAADAANEKKSAFLATMSHEIRTPLGVILGYADLLESQHLNEQNRIYAQSIQRNGQVLLALVNDILDLAKVESGKIEVEKRRLFVAPYFRELISQFQVKTTEKGISLRLVVEDQIPEVIETDDLRYRQVLTNLIGNAIKFTDHGGITVTLRLVHKQSELTEKSKWLLQALIQDTGPGIAPEHHDKIFEPFAQAAAYINRKFGGTGLGLSLARNLAEILGGELRLENSEVGLGSSFSMTIDPGDLTDVRLIDQTVIDNYKTYSTPPKMISGANQLVHKSILLVEDFKDNQLMIKSILAHHGAIVDIACNGEEGVKMALSRSYDLIFMDIQMPILNGYEAISRLRLSGYDHPVVALTAEAMRGELERCREAGFDDYLAKPVSRLDLISIAKRYILGAKYVDQSEVEIAEIPLESMLIHDDVVKELLDDFSERLQGREAEFRAYFHDKNWNEIGRLAHQISGVGGSFGYPELSATAKKLEIETREININTAAIDSLIDELGRLARRIQLGLTKKEANGKAPQELSDELT